MAQKKTTAKKEPVSDYRIVGYVFLAVAFGMFLSEATRTSAIAFFVIGITFVLIEKNDVAAKKKSLKKKPRQGNHL